jgi:putative (di)nucleoside polyphosphate hydrolase
VADLYRRNVGLMLIAPDRRIFVGRRAKQPDAWQMPQGGIDKGEEPLQAAQRELYEETGMRSVSLLDEAPNWIYYDLPADLVGIAFKGRYRGQTQKWFAFRFHGDVSEIEINPPPGGHTAEFDRWAWRPMQELPDLIVPFKRKVYEDVVAAFRHLVA